MRIVNIYASKNYEVIIGKDLLERVPDLVKGICMGKIMLVTDSVVDKLYADTVVVSLERAGYEVHKYIIESGEASKNVNEYISIINVLAKKGFVRSDGILSLGGGVVGDLAGFVASTYMRGIAYIQMPTTLLAAIDSSVGGKTAVNLREGKNLVGAFYQPNIVICDINTLQSLPEELFRDGLAEGIKYGILEGGQLWSLIEREVREDLGLFVELCVTAKKRYVEQDERDKGIRMHLNLGHTIGHALEKLSDYELLHGFAVAKGIALIAKASLMRGLLSKEDYERILLVFNKYNFDLSCDADFSQLVDAMKLDKKVVNEAIILTLIKGIGDVFLEKILLKNLEEYFSVCGNL